MKLLMVGVLSIFSLSVMANKDWEKLPFDQQKQMMQQKLEKKSAMIQEGQTCVNQAKDKAGLKACKADMEQDKQAMQKEWKDKKKQSQEAEEGLESDVMDN